jgi:hypothetical protein
MPDLQAFLWVKCCGILVLRLVQYVYFSKLTSHFNILELGFLGLGERTFRMTDPETCTQFSKIQKKSPESG